MSACGGEAALCGGTRFEEMDCVNGDHSLGFVYEHWIQKSPNKTEPWDDLLCVHRKLISSILMTAGYGSSLAQSMCRTQVGWSAGKQKMQYLNKYPTCRPDACDVDGRAAADKPGINGPLMECDGKI